MEAWKDEETVGEQESEQHDAGKDRSHGLHNKQSDGIEGGKIMRDTHKKLREGEPFLTLMARDVLAAPLTKLWAELSERLGVQPGEKVVDALDIAQEMDAWREANHGPQAMGRKTLWGLPVVESEGFMTPGHRWSLRLELVDVPLDHKGRLLTKHELLEAIAMDLPAGLRLEQITVISVGPIGLTRKPNALASMAERDEDGQK